MRKFTNQELETVINFNSAEKVAYVYTRQKYVWEDLKRKGFKPTEVIKNGRIEAMKFEIPKTLISIRKVRTYTVEQKARMRKQGLRLASKRPTLPLGGRQLSMSEGEKTKSGIPIPENKKGG